MKTDVLDYPSESAHNQLSFGAMHWPTFVAALIMIPNIMFWLLIEIKNATFETLPYFFLHLSSQYETLFEIPGCIATIILLAVIGLTLLDPIRPKQYRKYLLIGTVIFLFVNLYGSLSYFFGGSKYFDTISSISIQNSTYHLALMDENWCNNPPCTAGYYFRLYKCDSTDISCQILFSSEKLRRWLGEPNKTAFLSDSSNNTLQVILDDIVIYIHNLSP